VALADINTTESSKLSGIEAGATAGAPFGSFLAGVPVEIARSATPTSMMEDWGSYVSASVAQAAWNFGPAGAVSIISGSGFTAGRALQVTGACVITGKHRAAFDFDALYRVKVRAQVSTLGSGNSHFVGITAFDSTGTELAFPDSGVYHYPAGGNTPAATGTFEWEGYFRGVAVPGTGANVGGTARNPSEATPIRAGAVMIAPVFLANQGGSGGVIRIDYMTIEKVEDLVTATPTLQVPPTLTFDANFSGGLIAGQVPRAYTATRRRGHLDVSGSTAWSLVTSGCTASISTGGIVTVTACTAPGFIDVTSARNGVTLTARTSILRPTAPPPNVADSTASTTTIGAVSSNTYGTVHAGPFNVTAGSAGQIALSAPLSYSTLGGLPTGTFGLLGKWQIQIGGTWTDVAAEVAQSSNDVVLDEGGAFFSLAIGGITINQTATGLTPGTSYPCRLLMRTPSGTRPRYPFGTAVGVGS